MKVVISQSNYIPWRGFIDLIRQADVYVVYDSMQFTKNDWRNRNLICNNGKVQWLSVPCGSSISRSIDDVYPVLESWNEKHLATIRHCYSKALFWPTFSEEIIDVFNSLRGFSLTDINMRLLSVILKIENINTKIVKDTSILSRDKIIQAERSERLVWLCKELGASAYISAPAARCYLREEVFAKESISVSFYDYPKYAPYAKRDRELSWIDTLVHKGSLF